MSMVQIKYGQHQEKRKRAQKVFFRENATLKFLFVPMLLLRLSTIALPLLYFQPKFLFRNTSRMITTINFTHVGDKEGCMHPLHMFQYEFSQTANADTKDSYLVLISWSKTCVKLLILYLLMCVYLQKLQVIPPPLFTGIYLL